MSLPLQQNGITITLRTVKVINKTKKPGPVFLKMAKAAYDAGADYFYRVNDDTEFVNNWSQLFVKTLNFYYPPIGVVSPLCPQGNSYILTQDFVHRIHMEIFDMNYYPPELEDWWMDDWISLVYGSLRTFQLSNVLAVHHVKSHEMRYSVDRSKAMKLPWLILDGQRRIRRWMVMHNMSVNEIQIFDEDGIADVYEFGFKYRDAPFKYQKLVKIGT